MGVKDLGNRPAPATIREFVSRLVRGHGPSVQVERRVIPYWQERGWTREKDRYNGSYRTVHGSFFGFADKMSPLGNASADACADYAITLFSDLTKYVTMQNLYHDGGFSNMGVSEVMMNTFAESNK